MRIRGMLSFLTVVLTIGLTPAVRSVAESPVAGGAHRGSGRSSGRSSRTGGFVSPRLRVGPQAIPAASANPTYGLFSCQVAGLIKDFTCYDPYQIRRAYSIDEFVNAHYDGHGRTIVIIDSFQSPHIVAELNTFDTFYGIPGLNGLGKPDDPSLGTFTQVAPDGLTPFKTGDGDQTGWAAEISLDVEWAHAIAPGANITLVLAKSDADADILSATRYAIDNNLGDVISQSFGEAESCVDPAIAAGTHQAFVTATRKKMTIFASAGDDGAGQPNCDGTALIKSASSPANDPLVTAVGGTQLHAAAYCLAAVGCDPSANPAAGTWESEVVWNETDIDGAGGGGFSALFERPSFQDGAVRSKQRGVPDVAYNASVDFGVLTYLDIPGLPAGFYSFGGTSAGSPQWAAIVAILDSMAGDDLGFLNAGLYRIYPYANSYAGAFQDITEGNNSLDGIKGFNAKPGWDAVTGLGSPDMNSLVSYLFQYVSSGDGAAAIADARMHAVEHHPGRMRPH